MKPSSIEVSFDPHGLKVLLVDHNPTSLFLLSKMLQSCHYQVTTCSRPTEALLLVRNCEIKFDILITEINFSPDMNGIKFLEIIKCETDLPVVIVSAEDRINIMIQYITKGVCAYLPKPVGMEVIQLLWQHVARKEIFGFSPIKHIDDVKSREPNSSNCSEDIEFCGSSDGILLEDEQNKVHGKKNRLVWTDDLHQKFVDAVKQLGIQNAVPKKVLELMNVPGLRRENVASHLQKYRLNLQKLTTGMQESFVVPNSSTGVPFCADSSVIGHIGSCLATTLDHGSADLDNQPFVSPFHYPDHSL